MFYERIIPRSHMHEEILPVGRSETLCSVKTVAQEQREYGDSLLDADFCMASTICRSSPHDRLRAVSSVLGLIQHGCSKFKLDVEFYSVGSEPTESKPTLILREFKNTVEEKRLSRMYMGSKSSSCLKMSRCKIWLRPRESELRAIVLRIRQIRHADQSENSCLQDGMLDALWSSRILERSINSIIQQSSATCSYFLGSTTTLTRSQPRCQGPRDADLKTYVNM
ncbi:hypothetical protein BDW59DRAFT_30825 [Aspergillus cavernicola]|uniref:Uncharacterized protein n=1 Tax=Aspergillus cavernicola TaxID=176166 RepID=A0ABR4HDD5_9EURO